MTESPACPECGASLPADEPRGPCRKCLGDGAASPSSSAMGLGGPGPGARPVDLAGFRRAALDLGLVSAEDLDRFAGGDGVDAARLARLLVAAGKLTAYQGAALSQGRARGLAIGPYVVLDKRGQGGMGAVFRARHRQGGPEVALKVLLPSSCRDREAVLRFRREFEVAARLHHPNVVSALDASEDRGVQYLTMEFVDGRDLDALVGEVGPLPVKMSIHCIIQAAHGLGAAHAAGIIHRDVKPGNLMLGPTGEVRVLDLGLARVIEAANPLGHAAGSALTRSGSYMGTVDYIAPEQADDSKKADHRADIYALGCTLHFLLTGRPPFRGETLLQRLMAHQQEPAPSLLDARDDIPEPLEAAYQAMMAKRPADRPRSMAEVAALLEACRSSADEAKQAGAGLKSIAEAAMKRAAPRKRDRSRDASVFARPSEVGRLGLGPDLRLEDVVDDYRDEAKPGQLDEDKLPPILPRSGSFRRRRRRTSPARVAAGALALLGLAIAGYALTNRGTGPVAAGDPPTPRGPAVGPLATARPASARDSAAWTPLFNGKDLAGWSLHDCAADDWEIVGGELVATGRDIPYMAIFTEKEYANFRLRLEFRASEGTNSGVILGGFNTAGGLRIPTEINISELGHPLYKTGVFMNGEGRPLQQNLTPKSVEVKPGAAWNALEIGVDGGRLTVSVNGQALEYDETPTRIEGPRRIGLQGYKGTVRFRKVAIQEWESEPEAASPGDRLADRPPRVLHIDEFSREGDPPRGSDGKPLPADQVTGSGEGGGVFFIQEKGPGNWGYNIRGDLVDFSCEAVGRVLRGRPNAQGAWGLLLLAEDRGLQVMIDGLGRLEIEPSFWTADKYPGDPRIGPIAHPAIRPGNVYNTLKLNVRRRRLEVLVNDILVCEPIRVDWDLTPALVEAGLWVVTPRLRAEFDRMVIRELPPDRSAPAPSPIGTWNAGPGRRIVLQPGGSAKDSLFPIARWSRAGTILDLEFRDPRMGNWVDRVELDEDGSHFRGANQRGDREAGFRVAPNAAFAPAGVVLNPIPAGSFDMGTSDAQVESFRRQFPGAGADLFLDEQPRHRVRITRPFYLGATEVTVGQFRQFVDDTGYRTDAERDGGGARAPGEQGGYVDTPGLTWQAPGFGGQGETHPVVNVSWNDATAFCAWLSQLEGKTYRLPTEAEWEYACRAGTTTRYATGDDPLSLEGVANVADLTAREKYPNWPTYPFRDHATYTQVVAHYRPNAFGLYDMTGNAWEWCSDRYDATYYGRRIADDPKGPSEGAWRILRGGGWNYDPPSGRPADRAAEAPDRRFSAVGFRVVRELAPGERIPAP